MKHFFEEASIEVWRVGRVYFFSELDRECLPARPYTSGYGKPGEHQK